jgi:hypothetical protein
MHRSLGSKELVHLLTPVVNSLQVYKVPLRGLETIDAKDFSHQHLRQPIQQSDAKCGAVDAENIATMETGSLAAALSEAILRLSAEDRARLVALILAGPR